MTAVADRARPQPAPSVLSRLSRLSRSPLDAIVAVAVAGGVILRLWPRSALWLDEAQSVAIARPPLRQLPGMLRTDGAPPLYYAFLHGWMRLFGDSNYIVRLPSVLASLIALPLFALAARRLFGGRAGPFAVALAAVNPFTVRYATEARMYAFVVLEVLVGILAVQRYLTRPTRRRWLAVAGAAAALLWTHYWAPYLLAGVGSVMVVVLVRQRRQAAGQGRPLGWRLPPAGVLVAFGAAGVAFLPWFPIFLFQSQHTATPWAEPADWWQAFDIVYAQSGGHRHASIVAGTALWTLIALGVLGHRRLGAKGQTTVALLATFLIAGELAVLGSISSSSAFSSRYTSVVLPLTVLLAGAGLVVVANRWLQAVALVLVGVIGLALSGGEATTQRTPAPMLVHALQARANPGDVVVFCPDQLGPAFRRVLGAPGRKLLLGTFPDWTDPSRVMWIDYERRHRLADASRFAAQADAWAGSAAVWLVWSDTYPPTQTSCSDLRDALTVIRGGEEVVVPDEPARFADHGGLLRYG